MSLNITYIVNATYIKDNTIVDENVDEKYIRIAIQDAQNYKLKYLIGSGFYNEIIGQIQNNTLTTNNTTLLNSYVLPYLVEETLVNLLPYTLDKVSNRNVGVKDSEKTTAIDYNRMEKMSREQESKAGIRAKELRDYIYANPTLFPTFFSQGTGSDVIQPQKDNFEMGIFTGRTYLNVPRILQHEYPQIYGCPE